jgi:hypothetical protein
MPEHANQQRPFAGHRIGDAKTVARLAKANVLLARRFAAWP